jgi:hypothetical protein
VRRSLGPLSWLIGLVVLAGCLPGGSNVDCEAPSVELQLALSDAGLEPGDPAVCRDQEVTLSVQSVVDGILHIHGYDSEVPAFEVRSGQQIDIAFTASRSGQFPVEFHPADDPAGIEVGIFTVHEP